MTKLNLKGCINSINLGQNEFKRTLFPLVANHIFEYGMEILYADCKIPTHSHENQDEIIFIHKGELECTLDGKVLTLKEGDSVFLPCKSVHSFRNRLDSDCVLNWTLIKKSHAAGGEHVLPSLAVQMKDK
jgi:quercetin dioxygenase-like cupin family protein